ncbi:MULTISPECIES: putative DNA modification/repair radical SAM protein [Fervidobacterium]|uniref:Helix-hairpin-helix motif n=1 Tax=Fervidobacterium nodosum (strain ATCC 35602 / DSM 5306 / Rt17-B1) TaxID=381764 RepID=A7HMA6_FERNB|nr:MULTISPECIES: putative DNA modification/repair radical SAM protein [Fervidobacterium]ABS61039.1 helix-hairpin-helix motif [Fervidobacterium nodosum Rt17-B1]KAF2962435.1 radical SAM protein [Fervidobacterium sp. 2310opik-2]
MTLEEKLSILSAAAKYDVSCSFGERRKNFVYYSAANGKYIPILKILLSNACIYDCAYCINRKSNNIRRATFTVDEVVKLTLDLYKRNYIEGLFLSSAIIRDPNYTMEQMIKVAKKLKEEEKFPGYIHLKIIPGADEKLIEKAGMFADRVSINVEFLKKEAFFNLTPEKKPEEIQRPLHISSIKYLQYVEEKKRHPHVNPYSPLGQTTQIIVGATNESDKKIIEFSNKLYKVYKLKRVYYSGYVAINNDERLPQKSENPLREHRLYQADFLIRFYNYSIEEIFDNSENLDLNIDPKTLWALKHPELFPIDISRAKFDELIRIPGIGLKSARKIIELRKYGTLNLDALEKIGVSLKRAKDFITVKGKTFKDLKTYMPLFEFSQNEYDS